MRNFLFFGDSIAYGAFDGAGGWVQRFKNSVFQNDYVYNLGVPGDTSYEILKRFLFETEQRTDAETNTVLVFAVGINDSISLVSGGHQTSESLFKDNLNKIVELAKGITKSIIFVGLTPVDESKTNPVPWALTKNYRNEFIEKYSNAIKVFCSEHSIPFLNIFDIWKTGNYKVWLEDGVHPNSLGHEEIFRAFKQFIDKGAV